MERIRDAVERARQERAAHGIGIAGAPKPFGETAEARPEVTAKAAYTTTRQVVLPQHELRERRIVSAYERCLFTDACKILSTQVSQRLRQNRWNTLAVTSPREGAGKTLVAINLAVSLAMEFHQTAMLVDADLSHPRVRHAYGLPRGPGLSDYLLTDVPVEQVLVNPGIPGLVIFPGGAPLSNSSEMLGSQKMRRLVRELKERYSSRIVVFDVAPLLTSPDVLAFAPYVDAALMVVEDGKTPREEVSRAAELLGSTPLLGTVLNKSDELGKSVTEPSDRVGRRRRRRGR